MLDNLAKVQQGTIKVADKFADKNYLHKKTEVCQVWPLASIFSACFLFQKPSLSSSQICFPLIFSVNLITVEQKIQSMPVYNKEYI